MKKKLIVGLILLIMILPMFLNFYKVEAFSGELDPKGYISLPMMIWIQDGIATGTIRGTSGYTISYQKVDLTTTQYNNIENKNKEITEYVKTGKATLETKKTEIDTLKTEWENLKNSGTATQEQITEAQNKYNEAVEEYNGMVQTYNTNYEKLETEFYELIPSYTSSWIETTNTEKNVELDFSGKSGVVHFVLWAKITNGTDTYYDMNIYSQNIQQEESISINKTSANIKVDETLQLTATSSLNSKITWTSSDSAIATVDENGLVKGIKEGSAVITAKGSEKTATCTVTVGKKESSNETDDGDWTDFSNAKFELKRESYTGAKIEISNVVPKEKSSYYLLITSDAKKPSISDVKYEDKILLSYDKDNKILRTSSYSEVAKYIELNQDIYISIIENDEIVVYGKKMERYTEPKYYDAFFATFMVENGDQIIMNFTHSDENDRKIQVKVGKITDIEILKKIRNKDSAGFVDLLKFAKKEKGMYDKILDADKKTYAISYNSGEGENPENEVIKLSNLQDNGYYFLYVKTIDENGKFTSHEAVTLAQANVNKNSWGMFFFGDDDFEWTKDTDPTTADKPHADAGKITIGFIAIVLVVSLGIGYIKTKKYKGI